MSSNLKKVQGEQYLYQHVDNHQYYLRKRTVTEDNDCSLKTTSIKQARSLRDRWANEQMNRRLGITGTQKSTVRLRIDKALDAYHRAGFPDTLRGQMRYPGEKHLRTQVDAVVTLNRFFKAKHVDELDQDMLDKYLTWREKNVAKGDGARTTDLELNTLSKALDWAVRKKKLDANPIATRTRYHSYTEARHCKTLMPTDALDLHGIAAILFGDPRGEMLSWQFLFEANFGMRTDETLQLLMDAKNPEEPGFVTGESMYVRRADKADRINPCIHIHPEGRVLLDAITAWHRLRYPNNSFMFPGRNRKTAQAVDECSLTRRLELLFKNGILTRKFTSHGCRAYYVTARRSWGIPDSQIAWELNQIGGLDTLRISYGGVPPSWLDGRGPKLTWLPEKKEDYAWHALFLKLGLKVGDVVAPTTV